MGPVFFFWPRSRRAVEAPPGLDLRTNTGQGCRYCCIRRGGGLQQPGSSAGFLFIRQVLLLLLILGAPAFRPGCVCFWVLRGGKIVMLAGVEWLQLQRRDDVTAAATHHRSIRCGPQPRQGIGGRVGKFTCSKLYLQSGASRWPLTCPGGQSWGSWVRAGVSREARTVSRRAPRED